MKVSLLKSVSLVAFLVMAAPVKATVVAKVDGHEFTKAQVMEAKDNLPKQYQSAPEDKIFPVLVDQAIDSYLITQAAQKDKVEDKPEVKKTIEKAIEGIIAQAYLLDKVKDKITDAQLQEKYNEVIKKFPEEKEVHLRHILVDNKETAQSVIKALKNGTDFKKLAQTKSKDGTAKEGGDLGFFRESELPKELAEAAFALTPGAYSQDPVKSDFGWHVLLVEEKRDAKPPKFDEIKNQLKALMTQEAIGTVIESLRASAKIEKFDKDGKPIPPEPAKPAAAATPAKPETAPAAPAPAK